MRPSPSVLEAAGGICVGKLVPTSLPLAGRVLIYPGRLRETRGMNGCFPVAHQRQRFCRSRRSGAGGARYGHRRLGSKPGFHVRNRGFEGDLRIGESPRRDSLAFSLDHVGPMTRTVRENAALLQVVAGHDSGDPASANQPIPNYLEAVDEGTSKDLRGLRIGVIRHFSKRTCRRLTPCVQGLMRRLRYSKASVHRSKLLERVLCKSSPTAIGSCACRGVRGASAVDARTTSRLRADDTRKTGTRRVLECSRLRARCVVVPSLRLRSMLLFDSVT